MIKMELHAGLCNQIFMIFATIAYSLKHKQDYVLYYDEIHNRTLDGKTPTYFSNLLKKIKDKTEINYDESLRLYNEPVFSYQEIPNLGDSFNIKGYYQSYKYFENYYNEILEITGIKNERETIKNEFNDLLKSKPLISIHFRIGDYYGLQANHPIMPPIYYEKALQYLESKINLQDYNIVYFCQKVDNLIISKYIDIINKNKKYNFHKISDEIPDWKQLLLMSMCEHHIIANSSFSWWGAYMAENDSKIICYPEIWFGPNLKHLDIQDMHPQSWHKILFK